MKNIFALVFVALFALSCTETEQGGNLDYFTPDIVDTITDILVPPMVNPLPPISVIPPLVLLIGYKNGTSMCMGLKKRGW